MTIALAGRRIDSPDADDPKFPLASAPYVKRRLRTLLKKQRATALVSSAACGADLLALEEAGALGIRRRVILPFARERFRETSVVDRPGDWGPLYDRILDEISGSGDLIELWLDGNEDEAYRIANRAILNEALKLAAGSDGKVAAVLVWNSRSRGPGDLTEDFQREAEARNLPIFTVSIAHVTAARAARKGASRRSSGLAGG